MVKKEAKHLTQHEIIGVTVVVALLVLAFGLGNYSAKDNNSHTDTNGGASLLIDYGDGKQRKFEGPVTNSMSIQMALLAVENGGSSLDIKYSADGSNSDTVYIKSINGHANNILDSWKIYLNDHLISEEKLNGTPVKTGDFIELRYE